jgi:DNA invertase Pin-like site-specific DNA recombinase
LVALNNEPLSFRQPDWVGFKAKNEGTIGALTALFRLQRTNRQQYPKLQFFLLRSIRFDVGYLLHVTEGRTELATILDFLRPGDELVVARLDRVGRDTRDVLNLIHECEQKNAFVTVLDPHVSTRGEMGHIVLTVLGMVAQMERRFIKERQREGIEKARSEGVYRGGKRRLDRSKILEMKSAGDGPAAIAKAIGCSRMQVYRIIENG